MPNIEQLKITSVAKVRVGPREDVNYIKIVVALRAFEVISRFLNDFCNRNMGNLYRYNSKGSEALKRDVSFRGPGPESFSRTTRFFNAFEFDSVCALFSSTVIVLLLLL